MDVQNRLDLDGRRAVMVCYGTRPEAVKLAPVIGALAASSVLRPVVVVSGQHREMLDQINRLFAITPDADLALMTAGQTLPELTSRALLGYSHELATRAPDLVVVQGDTTTALAAALAAFYARIPIAHVEAGLRTHDRYAPFPEEINRRLLTQLSTLHLAPTALAKTRLLAEGVPAADIVITGNTVIDALAQAAPQQTGTGNAHLDTAIDAAVTDHRPIIVVTAHRRESWGPPMAAIGTATARIATARPDALIVLPAHLNPAVRADLLPPITAANLANVIVTDPLDYGPFAYLLARSTLILTDSGGLQEEAPTLGIPVLVLRDTTERPEAITIGAARLVGTKIATITHTALGLLERGPDYQAMATAGNPFGDGHAAQRTITAIEHTLGHGPRPTDFQPNYAALRSWAATPPPRPVTSGSPH
jgi:UDP-N-acetylglucosamine 2-epimerase (non-hydrolysing)